MFDREIHSREVPVGGRMPRPNVHDGAMAGHVKKGRVFKSPLAATGVLSIEDWIKDDFPDLLWPVLILAEQGPDGIRKFVNWQGSVQQQLREHGASAWVAEMLDGRLTHLNALEQRFPESVSILVDEAKERGLLSEGIRASLASYPLLPARWLVAGAEVWPPQPRDVQRVRDGLLAVVSDRHREALVKCLGIWSAVQARTFRADSALIDLLRDYPGNLSQRAAADSAVRASWGARKASTQVSDPAHFDEAIKWARVFWTANSMTSRCVRQRDLDDAPRAAPAESETTDDSRGAGGSEATCLPEDGEHLRALTMDLLSSFVEALETAPANLYENERQEVVSGLVTRAGRDLIAVLGAPDMWRLEHGAHIGRMLAETKIYLHWMAQQDLSIYRQFQDYGAGKAKLYSLILDEVPEEARAEGFREGLDELRRRSRNDDVLDHRVVDTRDSFALGKSIRDMAIEADLEDLYRHTYQISSGVSHLEWWSIETHAMEPCLNVLHGHHLIPSLSLSSRGNVDLATAWMKQFYSLARAGLRILGTDKVAVEEAFAWIDDPDTGAGTPQN